MLTRKQMIEDIARAMAAFEGKVTLFDLCKGDQAIEEQLGHYEGYIADAETLVSFSPVLEAALTCLETSLNDGGVMTPH